MANRIMLNETFFYHGAGAIQEIAMKQRQEHSKSICMF